MTTDMRTSEKFEQVLAKAKSFRGMIEIYLMAHPQLDLKKMSYSELARRCAFNSRSFPRDVIINKKSLSVKSIKQFQQGMGLKNELKLLFEYMVYLDCPETRAPNLSALEVEALIKGLKQAIKRKSFSKTIESGKIDDKKLLSIKYSGPILSCLSVQNLDEVGSSINEIKSLLGITNKEVQASLNALKELGLVVEEDKLYFSTNRILQVALTADTNKKMLGRELVKVINYLQKKNSLPSIMTSLHLRTKKENLEKIKQDYLKFVSKLASDYLDKDGDQVFSLHSVGTNEKDLPIK